MNKNPDQNCLPYVAGILSGTDHETQPKKEREIEQNTFNLVRQAFEAVDFITQIEFTDNNSELDQAGVDAILHLSSKMEKLLGKNKIYLQVKPRVVNSFVDELGELRLRLTIIDFTKIRGKQEARSKRQKEIRERPIFFVSVYSDQDPSVGIKRQFYYQLVSFLLDQTEKYRSATPTQVVQDLDEITDLPGWLTGIKMLEDILTFETKKSVIDRFKERLREAFLGENQINNLESNGVRLAMAVMKKIFMGHDVNKRVLNSLKEKICLAS